MARMMPGLTRSQACSLRDLCFHPSGSIQESARQVLSLFEGRDYEPESEDTVGAEAVVEEQNAFWQVAVVWYNERDNREVVSFMAVYSTSELAVSAALAELGTKVGNVISVKKKAF